MVASMRLTGVADLQHGPFTVAHAREFGMTWDSLQTREWLRLSRGQYAWTRLAHDAMLALRAAQERMPRCFALSGPTAGWLWGLDYAPCTPIQVTVPRGIGVRARAGLIVRRASLTEADVTTRRGLRVTSALRTVCDLGSRRDLVESVIAIDMATHAGLVDLPSLVDFVEAHRGHKGIKRLRRAVGLAEPATESPMETRLRLAIVRARLPRPRAQVKLHDEAGCIVARVDLYYPDRRLAIEYDGEGHKDSVVPDMRRQNALVNAGYHILRFTAPDIRIATSVVAQVRRARTLLPRQAG